MNIKTETVIRSIVLLVALVNQILAILGKEQLPIYENELVQIVTMFVTLGSSLWAWWKNNSFTKEAIQADEYLDELREKEEK